MEDNSTIPQAATFSKVERKSNQLPYKIIYEPDLEDIKLNFIPSWERKGFWLRPNINEMPLIVCVGVV